MTWNVIYDAFLKIYHADKKNKSKLQNNVYHMIPYYKT